ncbi:MAG: pyrroline-5-carboxylate reductase [Chloroflexi bacterium]|nr:pyrroline-5-carboxylate reductase [Chloroflexota bacterium]
MKISFIGGGNMGEAMLAALLDKGLSRPEDIAVSDVSEERRAYLRQRYGVGVAEHIETALGGAEVVVLAVKPQNLDAVLGETGGRLKPGQLVLSIVAGARLSTLTSGLRHDRVVRSMPNTPAQIGEGITVWTAAPAVDETARGRARAILSSFGREIYFEDENCLDMGTAVSGSGPAYLFYFVEALIEAAEALGFAPENAAELVMQTVAGSVHLLQKSGRPPAELRRMVTSPGGTTAAAIRRLEEGRFKELISEALKAARDRAQELGK